jgi:NitT/TauT family transport system substrate-binding protein
MKTRKRLLVAVLAAALSTACAGSPDPDGRVRLTRGAGGVGFLPLLVMEEHGLIEKHARAAGIGELEVEWIDLGGPAIVNDAILSGSADFVSAGPPAFLTLWDRTRTSLEVRGVAAMTSLPMYLNTHASGISSLDDFGPENRIAVTAIKVSIPAIVMQMYAFRRYGPDAYSRFDPLTVGMTHPDGVIAMLSRAGGIDSHFTSPPFHQREIRDEGIRTVMTTNDVMGGSTTFTMLFAGARYRENNPEVYRAVIGALDEAHQTIRSDVRGAAELLFARASGSGFSVDEIVRVLEDPDIRFTTAPENVMRYAEFMADIGSISVAPESWKDLFFEEIHGVPGS